MMNHEKLMNTLLSGAVGLVLGWTATALTLGGRVSAVEQSLLRIEARLEQPRGKL
jgi:hypothetical protein